ncbi:hypothetical protein RHGRI_036806 [Rhododendron griersonianum]|uniref:Uncharacterized protein n=1 Tax=Rhododendron griersonianum TaxID=479676 RepID=A0AAV6HSV5_9ERIC|nr:hypothetical protein RHGRI_036806 [Rhododendron griersonianum]
MFWLPRQVPVLRKTTWVSFAPFDPSGVTQMFWLPRQVPVLRKTTWVSFAPFDPSGVAQMFWLPRRRYLVISDYLVVIADKCQCLYRRLGFHLLLLIPLGSPKCFGVQEVIGVAAMMPPYGVRRGFAAGSSGSRQVPVLRKTTWVSFAPFDPSGVAQMFLCPRQVPVLRNTTWVSFAPFDPSGVAQLFWRPRQVPVLRKTTWVSFAPNDPSGVVQIFWRPRRRYLVISDYLVVIADKCQCLERRLGFYLLLLIPLGSPKCFGVHGTCLSVSVSLPQIAILLPLLLQVLVLRKSTWVSFARFDPSGVAQMFWCPRITETTGFMLKEVIGVAAMMPPYGVQRGFAAGSSGSRRRSLVISDYLVVITDKCQCLERRLGFHLLLMIPLGSPKYFGVQGTCLSPSDIDSVAFSFLCRRRYLVISDYLVVIADKCMCLERLLGFHLLLLIPTGSPKFFGVQVTCLSLYLPQIAILLLFLLCV